MSSDAPSTASLFRPLTRTQRPEGRNERGALITCIRSSIVGAKHAAQGPPPRAVQVTLRSESRSLWFSPSLQNSLLLNKGCCADHSQIAWQVIVESVCCPTPSNAYMLTSTHRIEERTPAPLDHHHSCQHQSLHYLGLSLASQM